jgi:hypothetical protein
VQEPQSGRAERGGRNGERAQANPMRQKQLRRHCEEQRDEAIEI